MSWFSQNYEKAALGGAAVVALGVLYLGWSKFASVSENFTMDMAGSGNNNTAVTNADHVPKAIASLSMDRNWKSGEVDGRAVDLFVGIPLFVASKEPTKPLDPFKGEMIHPPIPNKWWIDNRIDPGFSDSPQQDPDGDGFSNLEEFNAKTDPNNPAAIPSLIAKLMYVKDESLGWVLRPSYESNGSFPFRYEDTTRRTNTTGGMNLIAPGQTFFAKPPMDNRFKLLSSEVRKELNKNINVEMDVMIVRIEDQRPNKKGVIYELPSPLPEQRKNEFIQYDRSAVMSLEALGQNGRQFVIEENTAFAVPPDAPKKQYFLKKVTPEKIEVEHTNDAGEKTLVEIEKGNMPKIDP
ncbi:MAG: hypothetical protein EAZ42_05065 [Verrucomicrobia bacterium]|nr:MAG: hypothetical protein EAZ42_05065 [Verrucomicrobiota bacterium]